LAIVPFGKAYQHVQNATKNDRISQEIGRFAGRSGGIRTRGLLVPKMSYSLEIASWRLLFCCTLPKMATAVHTMGQEAESVLQKRTTPAPPFLPQAASQP